MSNNYINLGSRVYSYDDVVIMDGYSDLDSRSEVSLSQMVGTQIIELPVAVASMESINSPLMADIALGNRALYIQHRYCSVGERVEFAHRVGSKTGVLGVAVGLEEDEDDIAALFKVYDMISIDVAACNNSRAIEQLRMVLDVRDKIASECVVSFGNFSDAESMVAVLADEELLHRVDYLKVSQGSGSACSTRINIGVGMPTFQAVVDLNNILFKLKFDFGSLPEIIACGGAKATGDIVKAVGAGASIVLLGGMFAGHKECPGDPIKIDGRQYKKFRGMASREAKELGDKSVSHVEGVSSLVPLKGSVQELYDKISDNVRSGIATAGYDSILTFRGNADFRIVTHAGMIDGTPHVKGKIYEH